MKISYKSFGCRTNQIELESIIEKFIEKGYTVCDELYDLIIINSCCVTQKAENEVFRFIKKEREKNPSSKMIITGCLATLFREKILAKFDDVIIYPNDEKNKIVKDFLGFDDKYFTVKGFYKRKRAFVKVQDGCNLSCSYYIVSIARNKMISKPFDDVIKEIKELV